MFDRVELAPWVRKRLSRANDWPAELAAMRTDLVRTPPGDELPRYLYELGCAYEHCVPDRRLALAVLLDAARAGHRDARARALRLARSLRAHMTVAELCAADGDFAASGAAFLDAGLRELAIAPLQKLVDGRARTTATHAERTSVDHAASLLPLAKSATFDAPAELAATLAVAQQTRGAAAVPHYVHAARIARTALPERLTSIVVSAARACPSDATIEALVVEDLLHRSATTELLDHYRATFVTAPTRRDYVERMCSAAFELIACDLQRGLALRLLRLALETAYEELLPGVDAHIAAWEVLVAHAREQKSTFDLVPLVLQALAAPLSPDDALYLARLGLEIAWRDMQDAIAAQPYAATVLDFVADHPFATAFMREANIADVQVAFHPAKPAPAAPAVPTKIVKVAPPAIPYADDKPVPRVASTAKPPPRATNRLALLHPPPARTTTLRRDVSPIPAPPRPKSETTPRAPRVVVPIDVVIELSNGGFFSTVLRDLSTSGAFVVTKRKLEIGATLGLELRIPAPGAPAAQAAHQVSAKIARQTDIGYGIQFVDPSPELREAIEAIAKSESLGRQ